MILAGVNQNRVGHESLRYRQKRAQDIQVVVTLQAKKIRGKGGSREKEEEVDPKDNKEQRQVAGLLRRYFQNRAREAGGQDQRREA